MGQVTWIFGGNPKPESERSASQRLETDTLSDREKAAIALCRFRRVPETAILDGKPIWEIFLPEIDTVISALESKPD